MGNRKQRKRAEGRRRQKRSIEDTQKTKKAISERNRVALAYMELAREQMFLRLPEEQKFKLIEDVLSIGDEVASWIVAEQGTNDPRKIAAKLGVKVFGEDRAKIRGTEYRKENKEIVISRNFHEKLLREVKSPELSEHLLKFMVAHELFHHLEMNRIGEIHKRFKFEKWRIGPFVQEGHIKGLSDVAAQAFTQSLLGLEISPKVFDYLTYILYTNP